MTIAPPFTSADLEVALAAVIRGDVVTPRDPSYPAACFGYVSQGEGAPEIVVIAAEAGDVAAAVRVAARSGRRVALQGTGHTAPAAGAPTILVVTRLLARVSIDPAARTARVGAGSSWRQVLAATGPFGLVPVPSPVGHADRRSRVRAFTFAPDHVREFEVVTSAGAILRVDVDGDPERFHGLRAGRTAFGLVTAMTIDLQPAQAATPLSCGSPLPTPGRCCAAGGPGSPTCRPPAAPRSLSCGSPTRRSSPNRSAVGTCCWSVSRSSVTGSRAPGCSLRCGPAHRYSSSPCGKSVGVQRIRAGSSDSGRSRNRAGGAGRTGRTGRATTGNCPSSRGCTGARRSLAVDLCSRSHDDFRFRRTA